MPGTLQAYALGQGAFTQDDVNSLLGGNWTLHSLSGDTAVNGSSAGRRLITYAGGALALVATAPVAGVDDGKLYQFVSTSAEAHTLTCTGHLLDGAGHSNTATFAAHPAAGLTLLAYGGNFYVLYSNGITFS
jgi:hypothetical protein